MKNIGFLVYHPSMLSNWVCKLQPYFKDTKIHVIHISKLHGLKAPTSNNINLYDISWKSYSSNVKLVKSLSLDLMIFLNFKSILDFSFLHICRSLGIKCVYLEHGLYSKDTMSFKVNIKWNSLFVNINRRLAFWYNEIGEILSNKDKVNAFKLCREVCIKKMFSKMPFDHYFIYSQRSFENYSKIFYMNLNTNTTLVGYPIFNDEAQKNISKNYISDNGGILYVHQPLIADRFANITYDEEKEWLNKIKDVLSEEYKSFTLLLHPRGDLNAYKKRYAGTGIEVIQSPNNFKVFVDKSLVIGHYSTALLYGLYFNKPTVVLDYPTTKNDSAFSDFFEYIDSIEKLKGISFYSSSTKKLYLVGDYNTFEHIAKEIIQYINK